MSLPRPGLYRLRYLPNPDDQIIGGLVATEIQGREKPINAAPEEPSLHGKQIWEVREVPGARNEVEILFAPRDPQDGIGQIGFHYDADRPGVPIDLSLASKFGLEHVKENIWRIRPAGNWVGVDLVVGLNEDRHDETLSINPYPIEPGLTLPAWRFEQADT